jgi:Thiamine pyrophosphate-requiring enzymes [acetolactate synthase, pyruvate dehydrogenase (cytochrome), glyoxylate carboligase, phosphonopyruvate decarboxylase]
MVGGNYAIEYKKDKKPKPYKSKLDLGKAFLDLRDIVTKDCIYTLDAGNHSGWPQRFLNFGRPSRLIGSTCGSMGYGIPAAVAASILFPERLVIGFVGDGGFMMSGLELGTAMQYNAKPIIIIFNNENYGTIRMHQEREYPGRVYGTNLKNPNFCALGVSFNAFTQHVNETKDFIPAVKKAMDSKKMSLIELSVEKNQLSTRLHLDDIKKRASNG